MPTFRGAIVNRQILLTVQVFRPPRDPDQKAESFLFRGLPDTGAMIKSSSTIIGKLQRGLTGNPSYQPTLPWREVSRKPHFGP